MKKTFHSMLMAVALMACSLAFAGNDHEGNPGNNGGGKGGCGVGQKTNGCGGSGHGHEHTPPVVTPPVLIPGPVGPKGDKGDTGAAGANGKDGVSITGAAGANGKDGVSITGATGEKGDPAQTIEVSDNRTVQEVQKTNAVVSSHQAQINDLRDQIDQTGKAAYAGVAAALAIQMPALQPSKPEALTMRIGAGTYKGQSAVGVSFRKGNKVGDWSVTGGVSVTGQGTGVAVGVEHTF